MNDEFMTRVFLCPHTYVCEHNGCAIFRDLRKNKYLALESHHVPDLSRWVQGWPAAGAPSTETTVTPSSYQVVTELLHVGLVTPHDYKGKHATHTRHSACHSIFEGHKTLLNVSVRLLDVVHFFSSVTYVATNLSCRRLRPIVQKLGKPVTTRGSETKSIEIDDLIRLLRIFYKIRLWVYTAKDSCLFDSLVLAIFLRKYRAPCAFLMGVKTKPFGAHAWVQYNTFVVNDDAETIFLYTPILSVTQGITRC